MYFCIFNHRFCDRFVYREFPQPVKIGILWERGEVTERFKVLVLKTSVGQLTASSNLALSAKQKDPSRVFLFGGIGARFELAGIGEADAAASSA